MLPRILVGMKAESLTDKKDQEAVNNSKAKLGLFEAGMPLVYGYTEQAIDRRLSYNEVLEKNAGFVNPGNIEVLTEQLGLSNTAGSTSLFPSLCNGR